MSNSKFRQDLPPPGGYKPIQYMRIPAKTYFSGIQMFLGYVVIQAGGLYIWKLSHRMERRMTVEERSTRLALLPMLCAEKDRMYLMNMRRLRDNEMDLMKDVKGWEVGTYWGEPIYKTISKDKWMDVSLNEYFTHNSDWDLKWAYNFFKWF